MQRQNPTKTRVPRDLWAEVMRSSVRPVFTAADRERLSAELARKIEADPTMRLRNAAALSEAIAFIGTQWEILRTGGLIREKPDGTFVISDLLVEKTYEMWTQLVPPEETYRLIALRLVDQVKGFRPRPLLPKE